MPKFKYRLEPLVKIRENIREEKQAELAKAYEAARIIEEQIEKLRQDLSAALENARKQMQVGQINVDYLLSVRRHEAFLIVQEQQAQSQLKLIQEEIERRREAVIEADRDVKVLEKLREKLMEKHLSEEALAQLKQLDEVAAQKTFRNIQNKNDR